MSKIVVIFGSIGYPGDKSTVAMNLFSTYAGQDEVPHLRAASFQAEGDTFGQQVKTQGLLDGGALLLVMKQNERERALESLPQHHAKIKTIKGYVGDHGDVVDNRELLLLLPRVYAKLHAEHSPIS